MKFMIKNFFIYELFAVITIFALLIIDGLIGYLLRTFRLFIFDFIEFKHVFVASLLFGHFLLTIIFLKKFKNYNIQFKELVAVLTLNFAIIISFGLLVLDSEFTFIPFLIMFTFIITSIYLGFLFKKLKTWSKRAIVFMGLILITYINTSFIYPIILQVQNYKTLSGVYSKKIDIASVSFYDKFNNEINLKDNKVVLDFWHNRCGTCIKKFPDVEKTKDDLSHIQFYAVNVIENESDILVAERILENNSTTTQNIYIYKKDLDLFDISFFPTVILVDDNEIVFKGTIESLRLLNFIKPI